VQKELDITAYIESVEQEDVKFIMEMRYIDGKSWHDAAVEWVQRTGKYADRTTLSKKVKKYLREHPNKG
jgi:hypothetical protein